jgi:tetratricopeptide (TPR) repeat protein
MVQFCSRLLLGAALGAAVVTSAGAEPAQQNTSLPGPQAPDSEIAPDEALLQDFKCVVAVLGFHYQAAETACNAAIAISPASPLGYKFRGFNHLLQHQYESAEPDFLAAIKLDPDDADNQAGYAQALSGQGRFAEAVKQFAVALRLSPHDVRFLGASCWARAGEGKNFAKALADCNLALKLDPNFAVAYDSRALVYLRQGRFAQSIQDYSRSLALVPGRATALYGRGIAEIHLNRLPPAHQDIFLARLADPEIDDIFIQLGAISSDCKAEHGSCVLPDDLRPKAPVRSPAYISVSYQPAIAGPAAGDSGTRAFDPSAASAAR